MGLHSPSSKTLSLEPVETPTPAVEQARPAANDSSAKADPQRDLRMTTADEFLAAAAKEYEAGTIDRVLWRQAADQHGRDVSLVIAAYLRARATALQLRHKAPPAQIEASDHGAKENASVPSRSIDAEPRAEVEPDRFGLERLRNVPPKAVYIAAATVALVSAVAIIYLVVSLRQSESTRAPVVAAAPAASRLASATPIQSEQARVMTSSRGGANESGASSLAATVRELKIAGNWNVLVLYANEWTRKEPNNAVAWRELSVGYANLHQFNDALDAATKAVELWPEDALSWRNLGQINLTVDRLHEAGIAFGRSLAVNPDDAVARCGAAQVTQRQERPKDPTALTRRVGPADGGCFDMSFDGAAMVSAGSVRTPGSSAAR